MIVRVATRDDAAAIARIHVRSWQAAYHGMMPASFLSSLSVAEHETSWRRTLTKAGHSVWVVEDEGDVIGWAVGGRSQDPDAAPGTGELHAINIDPEHWSRGAGGLLCSAIQEAHAKQGWGTTTLWVLKLNQRARRFYESVGWTLEAGVQRTREFGEAELVEVRYRSVT